MSNALQQRIDDVRTLLHTIAGDFPPAVFASSLGAEDMVLTDLIHTNALPIEVFTLDTGRLPEETHALIDAIGERYGKRPRLYFPQPAAVEAYGSSHYAAHWRERKRGLPACAANNRALAMISKLKLSMRTMD